MNKRSLLFARTLVGLSVAVGLGSVAENLYLILFSVLALAGLMVVSGLVLGYTALTRGMGRNPS
ncbi:MAG TPA: hypothetical protein G4O04_06155 [Anaerolineae bacterium]|nr:hypothetical protein [Anaerolineae bacterium]HIQ09641.1 hypothetical protein [Anaerolineaceae bacterium]